MADDLALRVEKATTLLLTDCEEYLEADVSKRIDFYKTTFNALYDLMEAK